jgi:hypothetical protein
MLSGLFTEFERQNRPLSAYLWGQASVRHLRQKVGQAQTDAELAAFLDPARVLEAVASIRTPPPHAGPLQRARVDEGGGSTAMPRTA